MASHIKWLTLLSQLRTFIFKEVTRYIRWIVHATLTLVDRHLTKMNPLKVTIKTSGWESSNMYILCSYWKYTNIQLTPRSRILMQTYFRPSLIYELSLSVPRKANIIYLTGWYKNKKIMTKLILCSKYYVSEKVYNDDTQRHCKICLF